ncbi:MAG: DUF1292 domain-containing protein [Lachnospiraceae bacterium]|nr:DUF1292 domain-containing protein [Lachnospiraceae bacterium]
MLEKIVFVEDDGTEVELYVWEETKVNGVNYLLVSEDPDEDSEVYIFREVKVSEDEEVSYEPVEDDHELEYIGKVFEELLSEDEE